MHELKDITNWESVRGKLFLRLTNYEKNKTDINEKIHVPFLDLAILIYCDWKEWGCNGFYVSGKHLLMWKQDSKNIYQTALENTFRKNNTLVTPLMNLLPEEAVGQIEMGNTITKKEMIVLTNKSISFGAAMLLNTPALKKLADRLGSDLYLLPSSVHEILAVCPDQDINASSLMNMVYEVNNSAVAPEDYLSDSVYYFDREKCEVTFAIPA